MSEPRGSEVDRLLAFEAIRAVTARYWRAMDTKQWAELCTVFTDDVVMTAPDDAPGAPPARGADQLVDTIRAVLGEGLSVHQGTNAEIELDGPDRALAWWAMRDEVTYPDDPSRDFAGAGHYRMRYRRTPDGDWLISAITLRRLRLRRGAP